MRFFLRICILFLSKLLPINGEIVFMSFKGHYSDSPKAVSERLYDDCPNIRQVWLVDFGKCGELPKYVVAYDIGSLCGFWHLANAAVVVDNVYGRDGRSVLKNSKILLPFKLRAWLHTKKDQLNVSTWHGIPLKKMGRDQINSPSVDFISPPLTMIHPNEYQKNIMDRITFNRINSVVIGLPRNDILCKGKASGDIKKKLGIPENKKIILYAPTFRSDGYDVQNRNVKRSGLDQLNEIKIDELLFTLKEKFQGDWILVGRFHYLVEKEVDWSELGKKYPGMIINGNLHDDMAEYLACADILLTDYSSAMFDFALTERPCILYCNDYLHYKNEERGFYLDVESMPFLFSSTYAQLKSAILDFDYDEYLSNLKFFLVKNGLTNEGNASERVVNYIRNNSLLE